MTGEAFETYRAQPPQPVSVPRLIVGLIIIAFCWLATVIAVVVPGMYVLGGGLDAFENTRWGTAALFVTFAGIWIGIWLAMRFVHREPLANLFGVSGRLSWSDFGKGFAAIALTSVLSEVLLYLMRPEFIRTEIGLPTWLAASVPVALLCLLQTSSEEMLFRGYLMRNLASRFRSPWIWAVLPGLLFISLHMSPGMAATDALLVFLSIGSLTVAVALVVYLTGNLGAAFGMHFANNLFAFLLIAHQREFGAFALFRGASLETLGDTLQGALTVGAMAIFLVGLTLLLLLYRRSPLRLNFQI